MDGPVDEPSEAELVRVLTEVQHRGAIGRGSIADAVEHARSFVAAIPWPTGDDRSDGTRRRAVDLGSGGGLPGLVIAFDRPDLDVALVERRAKRADLLRYAVRSLGLTAHVQVVADDVRRVVAADPHRFDLVTARSFGPPEVVLDAADGLLVPGGWVIVSEPPDGPTRWASHLDGWVDHGRMGAVRLLQRR